MPARLTLLLTALVYLAIGLVGLLDPRALAEAAGIGLDNAAARTELRAVYGGMQLGLGLFLLLAARREAWARPGLAAGALCFLGLASARAAGLLVEGLDPLNLRLLAAELAGLALCGGVLWRFSPSPPLDHGEVG